MAQCSSPDQTLRYSGVSKTRLLSEEGLGECKFAHLSSQIAGLGCSTIIRWDFEEER